MIKPIYGLMAEFDNPTALVEAARAAREKGYRKLDAYSPFPIEELTDALHLHHNKLPLIVLLGGIIGGLAGYLLQYYVTVVYFPINVAGRPLHSWPSYIIITFEMTILLASISAVLGMLALCGLPMPYHPTFNVSLCAGLAEPVLPVHRGPRSAVRPRQNHRVSGNSEAQRGVRSCALSTPIRAATVWERSSARMWGRMVSCAPLVNRRCRAQPGRVFASARPSS